MAKKNRKKIKVFVRFAFLLSVSFIIIFPVFWLFLTAFKTRVDIFSPIPKIIFQPTLNNFKTVFIKDSFLTYYLNSTIISICSVFLTLSIGISCAYGLSRCQFKYKENLSFWILATRMMPPIAVIVPFFIFWREVNLLSTYTGLIILYTLINLGYSIWVLKSFIDEIPKELDEAASIDGCSGLQVLLRIILPICKPGLIASGLLTFITCWNEFLFALVLNSGEKMTAPVAVSGYITFRGINWGPMAAAGSLIIFPVLIVAIIGQKYIVKGLSSGAIK